MKTYIYLILILLISATSCLKDDIQYIDEIKPNIISGIEIQNGKYILVRDDDADGKNDTTIYEFIGVDSVITKQNSDSGAVILHGNWERIQDTNVVMTFEPGSSNEKIETFSNAFNIVYKDDTLLLLAPAMQYIKDTMSLVGQYVSYFSYDYTADEIIVKYIISIYNTGSFEAYTGITVNGVYDYYIRSGQIEPDNIRSGYYQLIKFQGNYYLYGIFAGKYEKVK